MSRVYCGNLPHDIKEKEVDDLFYKYGRIRDIHVVRRDRGAFAFVEYSDYRDAEDAVYGRDGYRFDGERLKCEMSRERRRDDRDGRDRGGREGDRGRDRGDKPKRERRERKPPTRADFGVVVKGLPEGSKFGADFHGSCEFGAWQRVLRPLARASPKGRTRSQRGSSRTCRPVRWI